MNLKPLFPNFTVPEFQLSSPKYPVCDSPVLGKITFTGGFMESMGHSRKPYTKAIFKDGNLMTLLPSDRNLGVDYVYPQNDKNIRCWYSGRVLFVGWENGYGNRCRIAYDIKFKLNGVNYPVFGAYAHAQSFNVKRGQIVNQGDIIGIEGGTGGNYPSHVDYRQWIEVNGQIIDISPNLLESQLHQGNHTMIEELITLKVGSRGNAVKWLQSCLELKTDGIFEIETEKAVQNFQQTYGLKPDGIVGELTARKLEMIDYVCLATESTVIKQKLMQSSELSETETINVWEGAFLPAKWVESKNNHWKIGLIDPINGFYNWFLFQPHFAVIKGYSPLKPDKLFTDWEKALIECETFGCSLATAKAEGHLTGGVATSEAIAVKDWKKFDKTLLNRFKEASKKYDIPVALILALASRESHLGSILGRGNNKAGWGDNNNAFGVFQVDKRYHKIQGQHDPFSWEHLDHAMGIFNQYRSEIQKKHPDWSQSNILKGACVAYNSGVNNVQTIEGMNEGTTNNDYGDDVIARAQEFFGLLVDLI
jgi:murein DD-endopeptidase MepM/ murein hydrolase activator NlpD